MEKNGWKIMAIIFIILFILQTSLIVWSYYSLVKEEERTYECFYEICEQYPDAYYEARLCTCYEYDVFGDFVVAKQKYMR